MLFSEKYHITERESTWFDPILDFDIKLFIDPFLICKQQVPEFKSAHKKLIDFFEMAFKFAAESGGKHNANSHGKLLGMLKFPEVSELCLGYTFGSIAGSGTGKILAHAMVDATYNLITRGIKSLDYFEEIALIIKGIGCDRTSDITANILKLNFITYTQNICKYLGVPMCKCPVRHLNFDKHEIRWESGVANLPWNHYFKRGILLVPYSFLRQLPTVNPGGFWDYLWDTKDKALRKDFNYDIQRKVNKKEIIEIAKKCPQWVREYAKYTYEKVEPKHYDLNVDEDGVYKWYPATSRFVSSNPLTLFARKHSEFVKAVENMANQYRKFVEKNGGYKLLWDQYLTTPKNEEAAQLLFLGTVKHYCEANNIDISRVTDVGRGPVDFKFSRGYHERVLLEVKLVKNARARFWRGLDKQLPAYLKAGGIKVGFFLAIVFKKEEFKKLSAIEKIAQETGEKHNIEIKTIIVDATLKPSASKVP